MKNKILSFLFLLFFTFVKVFSQVPPPPTQGENSGGTPGSVPVNQYLYILLALGIIFGISIYLLKPKSQKA